MEVTFVDYTRQATSRLAEAKRTTLNEVGIAAVYLAAALSRVDTSSYQQGWYQSGPLTRGYGEARSAAEGVNPRAEILDEVVPANDEQVVVSNVVGHAIIVEEVLGDHTLLKTVQEIKAAFPTIATRRVSDAFRTLP